MSQTRYRYVDETLTPEQAAELKARAVEHAEWDVARLESELHEARVELFEIKDSEPPKTYRRQIAVEPGEAGYDELPDVFDPVNYQGDIKWLNKPNEPKEDAP